MKIAIIGSGSMGKWFARCLAPKHQLLVYDKLPRRLAGLPASVRAKDIEAIAAFRPDRPRALPLLVERCRSHANIVIHENCRLIHATKTRQAASIVLKTSDSSAGKSGEIACHRILTAIGREPALDFLDQELRAALPDLARQKKLFLAGDVANGRFRQAAIAAAAGLRAAMAIATGGNGCA